jgi:hypothetical protein
MAKPLPLPVWDRQRRKLVEEWMDDHQPHYESEPQRSLTQWIKSQPLYDRLYALYENSRWSTREIPSRLISLQGAREAERQCLGSASPVICCDAEQRSCATVW